MCLFCVLALSLDVHRLTTVISRRKKHSDVLMRWICCYMNYFAVFAAQRKLGEVKSNTLITHSIINFLNMICVDSFIWLIKTCVYSMFDKCLAHIISSPKLIWLKLFTINLWSLDQPAYLKPLNSFNRYWYRQELFWRVAKVITTLSLFVSQ